MGSKYAANFDFGELLGHELVGPDGKLSTGEALAGAKKVSLYFSAHWCPPCRRFTPVLAQKFSKSNGDCAVVFVSSDQSEAQFREYYASMPWLALPFSKRDVKNALSKKYGVSGIPTLVVLDAATGKTITKEGRAQVNTLFPEKSAAVVREPQEPEQPDAGFDFSQLLGENIIGKGGAVSTNNALKNKKHICLYFSAHWCPPCRGFTPVLASAYRKADGDTEVVFISSDQGPGDFESYYASMPWLAVDYSQREIKSALSQRFGVSGIPTLVVLDGATGKLVTREGRGRVAEFFPKAPGSVCGGCSVC